MIKIKSYTCPFCEKETSYSPLPKIDSLGIYFCSGCMAEYIFDYSSADCPISTHLYSTINGKMYRWSVNNFDGKGRLWHVGEPGIPGVRGNKKMKMLLKLTGFQPITPQNVRDKIMLMLVYM